MRLDRLFNFILLPLQLLYIAKMRKAFMKKDYNKVSYYVRKLKNVVSVNYE